MGTHALRAMGSAVEGLDVLAFLGMQRWLGRER